LADPRVVSLAPRDMPRALFDAIAAQVFPHANYVQLSMFTEPFMTADFPDRLAAVQRYGVPQSHIITNGTLLTARAAEKIVEAQIATVTISIDGGTKETYEEIRVGARFENVVRNVHLLRAIRDAHGSARPAIRFNHVLSPWNIDRFDDFLAFAEEMHPDQLDVRAVERMTPHSGGDWDDPAFVAKVLAIRPKFLAFCARLGIADAGYVRDQAGPVELFTPAGERMTCRRPWDTVAIHANGDVSPCMAWSREPIGNLARQTFAEIWHGAAAEALRREFDAARPGVDCLFCTIKKGRPGGYDDFFYQMLAKTSVV
jgi:radical SAM protein with 4Fe4S-binding SPASM domain